MSLWKKYKLKDLCTKIGSGSTPRGGQESYFSSGISLIRSQNVLDFSFSKNGLAFISDKQADELSNVTVEKEDVLLNITGDSVARVCQVPFEVLPARVNQHVTILRAKNDILHSEYLKYYLLSPFQKEKLLSLSSSGATRNALTKTMIEDFDIKLPSISEQHRIASILSSLDDKIELNRKMNKTLEQMAQAIFKKWFVDDVDGNNLPQGWRKGILGDILELAYGKALRAEERLKGVFPVIGSNGIVGWHNEAFVKSPGIVIGRKGTIGEVIWLDKDFWAIDTTFYVVPKLESSSLYFLYFLLKEQDFKQIGSDSAVPGLNRNQAYMNEVFIPPSELIVKFSHAIKPIFDMISRNTSESKILSNLRDYLLPKLMSGEINLMEQEINYVG